MEYLGANGSQSDRSLLLCGLKLRIDLLWRVGQVITQVGKSGVENTGPGRVNVTTSPR